MEKSTNRREFIRNASGGIIGIGLGAGELTRAHDGFAAPEKVKVALVRNAQAINDRNVCDKKQAALMIDKALATLTGKTSAKDAWTALGITPKDVVGIKINCNGSGFALTAHTELVYALCESLNAIVPPKNVIIYERNSSELERAGFRVNVNGPGIRCFGTNEGGGFHPQEGITRIVTDTCTKLINLPSLKTFESNFAGSLFLKNHIGSMPPDQMSQCHDNTGLTAKVLSQPSIKNKTVLAFCDGLRGTWTRVEPWYWGGIIVSRDQVAAEYAALQVINEKRAKESKMTFAIPPYVKLAESSYKLGTCDPANIDMVKVQM